MIMGIIIRNFVKMMIKFVQVKNKYMYIKHIDLILYAGHRHTCICTVVYYTRIYISFKRIFNNKMLQYCKPQQDKLILFEFSWNVYVHIIMA